MKSKTDSLKKETAGLCLSETLASTDESTRYQNPEHQHPHSRENLECHNVKCIQKVHVSNLYVDPETLSFY